MVQRHNKTKKWLLLPHVRILREDHYENEVGIFWEKSDRSSGSFLILG